MKYLYYPGCTLKTKAKELDAYAINSMKALGVDFKEYDDWQCCGAVYPQSKDEIANRLSSIRALDSARKDERGLLTLCSACFHVMKRVNHDMQNDSNIKTRANNYLSLDMPYLGEANVVHFLEMLRDDIGFDKLKEHVKNPLAGRKIGAYYGCLLLRPSNVMKFDNPESPSIIEDFIRAIGAEPVVYAYRNECCGSYSSLDDGQIVKRLCDNIVNSAIQKGADCLITACPLCKYNLLQNDDLPTYYFTELLAEAFDVKN